MNLLKEIEKWMKIDEIVYFLEFLDDEGYEINN